MDPFRVASADWGVFIDIHTPLTSNDRASFIECLHRAREHMATINQRNVLIDLRNLDVIQDSDPRVRAYVSIVEHLEAQRVAVVLSSPSAAARIREALGAAGMLENSRVLVQNSGMEGALRPALRWVSGEQDAGDEAPPGRAAER